MIKLFRKRKKRRLDVLTLQEAKQRYLSGKMPYRYAVCRTDNIPYALCETYDSALEEIAHIRRYGEIPCLKMIDLLFDI